MNALYNLWSTALRGNAQYWGIDQGKENPSWVQGREPVTTGGGRDRGFLKCSELNLLNCFLSKTYWIVPSDKDYAINVCTQDCWDYLWLL